MKRFILSGGGTGGHIFPAIAIANELKKRFNGAEFLFIGANDRMEMQRVPQAGYPIEGLPIAGIQRKLSFKNILVPFKLVKSLWKAYKLIKSFKPDAVIGTGGYASAPTLKIAQWLGIPYFIQEQNSYAGVTNKWVSKDASKIFVAYEGMEAFFPKEKLVITGNPVREEVLTLENKSVQALNRFKLSETRLTLLVLGGSLGARSINNLIYEHLPFFEEKNIQILWQCGKFYYETYKQQENNSVSILPFIEDMNDAYSVADIIISRAGASSVSELCIVGKPVIFVPSPNVAEDHQTKNANAIATKNAAILIKENNLTTDFKQVFNNLLEDENRRNLLSENIKTLALPKATETIVNHIIECINNTKS